MGYQPDEIDDTWADLVPEQPKKRERLPLWIAIIAIVLVLGCLCAAGAFIISQEILPGMAEVDIPDVPTSQIIDPVETSVTEVAAVEPTQSVTEMPPPTIEGVASPTLALAATATVIPSITEAPQINRDVEAKRLTTPPVIDGLLDEWLVEPAFLSAFLVYQVTGWDGSDDLSAAWRLAWDEANLYIGVEVADDTHVQTQFGNQIFRGDSLDIQFDTDRLGDLGPALSPDDFQITFSPGDFGSLPPSAFRFQGTPGGQILDAPGGHHVILQANQTAAGYNLEAAIPWSDLNLTPAAGLLIGLSLNANDNDSPGTAAQEIMKSHISTRTLTDPSSWGTLTLR